MWSYPHFGRKILKCGAPSQALVLRHRALHTTTRENLRVSRFLFEPLPQTLFALLHRFLAGIPCSIVCPSRWTALDIFGFNEKEVLMFRLGILKNYQLKVSVFGIPT